MKIKNPTLMGWINKYYLNTIVLIIHLYPLVTLKLIVFVDDVSIVMAVYWPKSDDVVKG